MQKDSILFHPDFTVGYGFAPYQFPVCVTEKSRTFTAGQEFFFPSTKGKKSPCPEDFLKIQLKKNNSAKC